MLVRVNDVMVMFSWCVSNVSMSFQVYVFRHVWMICGDSVLMFGWWLDDVFMMCWWCFSNVVVKFERCSTNVWVMCWWGVGNVLGMVGNILVMRYECIHVYVYISYSFWLCFLFRFAYNTICIREWTLPSKEGRIKLLVATDRWRPYEVTATDTGPHKRI